MAITPIDPTVRFEPSEVTKWLWVVAYADYTAPTRTEVDTAKDLSSEVAESDGFTVKSDMVDAPDYGSKFTAQIAGRVSADESSLTFYMSEDGKDVRDLLHRGDRGYITIMYGGDVAAGKMSTFPVEVSSVSPGVPIGDAATIVVSFAITDEPAEGLTIPATTP